jgi:thiol-disulfide isomerase/thioredoxin
MRINLYLKLILMNSLKIFFIILSTFTAVACQNSVSESDTTQPEDILAMPHGEDVPLSNTSTEDLKKIATAKGKTVELVTMAELSNILSNTGDELIVCNFWATWCKPCIAEMPFFDKLQDEFKEDEVRIIFVSVDDINQAEKVKTFVREKQLRSQMMQMNEDRTVLKTWFGKIQNGWTGEVPATLFVRTDGDIKTFYTGSFQTYEELRAALYPLL